ncbi:MAG: hypothetical protein J6M42_10540 [Clostridia bacterium]|nr:hypothetical protein [Clostridia bacterium]
MGASFGFDGLIVAHFAGKCKFFRFSLAKMGVVWYTVGRKEKLQFNGELENAKFKMQNAKLMKPFAGAKAYLVVKVRE